MIFYAISVVFFLWLVIISWQLHRTKRHYSHLVKSTKKQNLEEILEKIITDDSRHESDIKKITAELTNFSDKLKLSIQKIGLLKFNAFEREGIGQSFVISLLDEQLTGIVVNFIQTKDGLRVYPKKVKKGKGLEYDLTDEEKKAIEKSLAVY